MSYALSSGAPGDSSESPERHPMQELLEASEAYRRFQRGDVVQGTIAFIGEREILIDVGAKTEGLLAPREFAQMTEEEISALSVGDEVECLVINPQDRNGNLVLSLAQAQLGQDWTEAERLEEAGEIFQVTVSGHNKGGLIAYVGEVRGFIPASQIDRRHGIDRSRIDGSPDSPLAELVGQELWVKVIEVDRRKNRLILSEQAAMRERRQHTKAQLLDSLEEGQIVEGVVTSLADFGAFVDIGGADGLVHLSELTWNRVSHPREVLQLGEDVRVKVISIDHDRHRIGLSLKQLQPEPWSQVTDRFQLGQVVRGTVTRLADFGAFARLEGDIEGLIHISELSEDGRAPEEVVSPGDELDLRIIHIDPKRKRIGLSLRRAGPEYDAELTTETLVEIGERLDDVLEQQGDEAEDVDSE